MTKKFNQVLEPIKDEPVKEFVDRIVELKKAYIIDTKEARKALKIKDNRKGIGFN